MQKNFIFSVWTLIFSVFILSGALSLDIYAQTPSDSMATDSQLSLDNRQKTFDLIWQKVADNFYDPNFKGVNWIAVRAKYAPEVEKTADRVAFHAMLNRMLDEIKESHLGVAVPGNPTSGVGFDRLVWAEKKILVKTVETDSPAGRAKIQVGDEIIAVDGISVKEIYRQPINDMFLESAELRAQMRYIPVERKLRGAPNSTVTLKIRDRNNKLREITLKRDAKINHGKLLPAAYRKLTPAVGYIQIPSYWFGNLTETFDKAFAEFVGCESLIVDVRGNVGGELQLLTNFVGRLMEKDGSLGEFVYRNRREPIAFKGTGEKAFRGKVVVLIDETSGSASELLAGGLKDLGRAIIVGNRSAGVVILSERSDLPSGGNLLYPIADVYTIKGYRIEANGVKPDLEVKRTRQALIEERDAVLEAAIKQINKSKT